MMSGVAASPRRLAPRASRLGSTWPSIARGDELGEITMVALGGVGTRGGDGTTLGVALAARVRGPATFGLGLMNVPGIVMSIVVGVRPSVVVASVAVRRYPRGGSEL